ncbi:superoxide dismutase [Clostridia bacterium]|nr:superoxide dismutase [Clostridia bacterium]
MVEKIEKISPIGLTYNTNAVSNTQFNEHAAIYLDAVKRLNNVADIFNNYEDIYSSPEMMKGLLSLSASLTNSVILHEEYFRDMSLKATLPGEKTILLLSQRYNSVERFLSRLVVSAECTDGYACLCYDQRTRYLRVFSLDPHGCGSVVGDFPILVLDVSEHAYSHDYGVRKREYIDAFIKSIDWNTVESRMEQVYPALQ